ncbi:MAG: hypothetical protein KBD15_00965 [Candidatus Magasanikbacteria bacterium]|nr:hypothetical protein [Candidatus Magasanikbacteria bacterium]
MNQEQSLLTQFGLSDTEARLYLVLNIKGELDVPGLAKELSLSRTAIYTALNILMTHQLIDYRKAGRNAYYRAGHPSQLTTLLEQKKRQETLLYQEMEGLMNTLVGPYHLGCNKPGVRIFDGEEEIRTALFATLESKEEILSFVEGGVIETYLKEINQEYVKKRIEKKVYKKIITTDTIAARTREHGLNRKEFTELKYINPEKYPFKTSVQMYDTSVLYLTLTETYKMGFLIQNESIAEFHKSVFRFMWKVL